MTTSSLRSSRSLLTESKNSFCLSNAWVCSGAEREKIGTGEQMTSEAGLGRRLLWILRKTLTSARHSTDCLETQTQCKCEAFHVVYASQEMSLCMLPEGHRHFEGCSLFHILSWLSLWFHSIVREVTEAMHPFQWGVNGDMLRNPRWQLFYLIAIWLFLYVDSRCLLSQVSIEWSWSKHRARTDMHTKSRVGERIRVKARRSFTMWKRRASL